MSLTLSDIRYTYGAGSSLEQSALDGVPLHVEPGELVLVLGSTGSGKSTLLRIATGLLEGYEGQATIDGSSLSADTARGRVGLVFQDAESQLFAETLLDDVMFGPLNLGVETDCARAQALEALGAVGLDPETFAGRSPFALSGGEARRAAIAGVIAMRPRYVLADEPTAGLDSKGRRKVHDVIESLRHEAGVVVVSHNAEEFLGTADRVLVLSQGRCGWWGTVDELLDDPSVLKDAGVDVPFVIDVQLRARELGLAIDSIQVEPDAAAAALIEARDRR